MWISIFSVNTIQSTCTCWLLVVSERGKVKHYTVVPWDKYLTLSASVLVVILLESWCPTVPAQWPIVLLCLSFFSEISAFWSARWRHGVRAITLLISILPLSFSLPLSFFFFMLQYLLLFGLSLSLLFSLPHFLQTFLPLSPLFAFSLLCRLPTRGKQCCSIPGGLIKVRSRSNTLRQVSIGKKKRCSLVKFPANTHHRSHHHHPLLEPDWPPAKINARLLVFSSRPHISQLQSSSSLLRFDTGGGWIQHHIPSDYRKPAKIKTTEWISNK